MRAPVFSPDGGRILFAANRLLGKGRMSKLASGGVVGLDLWILDIAARRVRQLTTDGAGYTRYSWSPDGRYVAAVSRNGFADEAPVNTQNPTAVLYTWDVRTGRRYRLDEGVGAVVWSGDSRRVFYEAGTVFEYRSVSRNGGRVSEFMPSNEHAGIGRWSPNGRSYASCEYSMAHRRYSVVVSRGCSSRRFLEMHNPAQGMMWSSDGRKLAFVADGPTTQPKLAVLDLRSGQATTMWMARGKMGLIGWSQGDWVVAWRQTRHKPALCFELLATRARDGRVVTLAAPAGSVAGFDWHTGP